jgi:hypothetical protein
MPVKILSADVQTSRTRKKKRKTGMNPELLIQNGFQYELALIRAGHCPFCKKTVGDFRNRESRDEYKISGLCQVCQDGFFCDDPAPEFCTERREIFVAVTKARNGFSLFTQ